jgi:hypothetical protein
MPEKITRLDTRRDNEAIEWAKELRETETWFQSQRFSHVQARGSINASRDSIPWIISRTNGANWRPEDRI